MKQNKKSIKYNKLLEKLFKDFLNGKKLKYHRQLINFYIQKREDALKVDWNFANSCMKDILYKLNVSRQILSKPVCFCNPPHSKSKLFVEQAYNQWLNHNLDIVMLLPVNVLGSEYSKKFILPFIKYKPEMFLGRIRFLDPITNKPSKYNSVNSYFTYAYYSDRNED